MDPSLYSLTTPPGNSAIISPLLAIGDRKLVTLTSEIEFQQKEKGQLSFREEEMGKYPTSELIWE
jgi:hypothetical protein